MRNLITVLMLTFGSLTVSQAQRPKPAASTDVVNVAYCDLLRSPSSYDGKIVRVRATYRYGYEWSEIYCANCLDFGHTWVDFDESYVGRTSANVKKKLKSNGLIGRTVNVVAVGKFFGSRGGYGHMGDYDYKLLVHSVEQAEIILNDSRVPTAVPDGVLQRTRCRTGFVQHGPRSVTH